MPARLLALLALRETSFEEGQRAAAALLASTATPAFTAQALAGGSSMRFEMLIN